MPATLLVVLLLATELATFTYGCRALKADVAVAAAAARKHRDTVLRTPPPAAPGAGEAGAVYGESKRLVPQGPNPLHN